MNDWPTPKEYWEAYKWQFIHSLLMCIAIIGFAAFKVPWFNDHPFLSYIGITVVIGSFTLPRILRSKVL